MCTMDGFGGVLVAQRSGQPTVYGFKAIRSSLGEEIIIPGVWTRMSHFILGRILPMTSVHHLYETRTCWYADIVHNHEWHDAGPWFRFTDKAASKTCIKPKNVVFLARSTAPSCQAENAHLDLSAPHPRHGRLC
jgi:hypothetical protein